MTTPVAITRVLRRLDSGVHKPPVVRGKDGHDYVVKLGNLDRDFPACELVAAALAPAFEVEVPPFSLLSVGAALRTVLGMDPEARWADLAAAQPDDLCFGSRWVDDASPVGAPDPAALDDPDSLWRLFAFDVYVENGDRRRHNPNLLVAGRRLVAIDHGQAVSGVQGAADIGGYAYEQHLAWPVIELRRSRLAAFADLAAKDAEIDEAVDGVPAGWWADSTRREFARRALRSRRAVARAKLLELSRS